LGVGEHVLLSKSPNRFLVNFHTKKPTTHNTATPPATESPMMVDVEMPELLLLPELLLAAVPEGDAEEEEAVGLETKTMLVTTWPPGSVVTTAEVRLGAAVAELLGELLGVLVDWAACVVDCCAADDGLDGVVVDCCGCCCCCCVDEAAGVFEVAACCVEAACDVAAAGEVLTLTAAEEAWRGERTCSARELSTESSCTRTNIRSPASATIPKNGTPTLSRACIFEGRAEMGGGKGKERRGVKKNQKHRQDQLAVPDCPDGGMVAVFFNWTVAPSPFPAD
jgi:hypothetical protein